MRESCFELNGKAHCNKKNDIATEVPCMGRVPYGLRGIGFAYLWRICPSGQPYHHQLCILAACDGNSFVRRVLAGIADFTSGGCLS